MVLTNSKETLQNKLDLCIMTHVNNCPASCAWKKNTSACKNFYTWVREGELYSADLLCSWTCQCLAEKARWQRKGRKETEPTTVHSKTAMSCRSRSVQQPTDREPRLREKGKAIFQIRQRAWWRSLIGGCSQRITETPRQMLKLFQSEPSLLASISNLFYFIVCSHHNSSLGQRLQRHRNCIRPLLQPLARLGGSVSLKVTAYQRGLSSPKGTLATQLAPQLPAAGLSH